MSEKKKSDLLSAFSEAVRPTPAAPTARTPRASAPRRAADRRPEAARRTPRGARAQGERVNLSFRVTPPTWERVRQLALSDRVSVQQLLFAALSREFERRGLPALED
ncbi:MAG TPA: hypothetical protein VHR45_09695 [Thermoanaerobaculia bacterium]|nr:hypothetical protein [Thermoanaerobaculia bacterium]